MAVIQQGRFGEADADDKDHEARAGGRVQQQTPDRTIGWHPHPNGSGIVWWDGTCWTIAVPEYQPGLRIVPGFFRRALMRVRLDPQERRAR